MEADELDLSGEMRSKPSIEQPTEPNPSRALPAPLVALMATACALSVANVYYAQPLLDEMARDFGVSSGPTGIVITFCHIGYTLGLFLPAPLGALVDRRRLVVAQPVASAAALAVVGVAPNAIVFLVAMFTVGMLAVVVSVLVAFA